MVILEYQRRILGPMRIMALAAVNLAPCQSEMFALEPGLVAVMAGQALRWNTFAQQTRKAARVRVMTTTAFVLCRCMRNTLGDQFIDVLVAA